MGRPGWDEDSPQLRLNLAGLLKSVAEDARARRPIDCGVVREWHRWMMRDLRIPPPGISGAFRGEGGLKGVEVAVGDVRGVPSGSVADELRAFEETLQVVLGEMDRLLPPETPPDEDGLDALLELMAWVHGEWIRIHPFVNGNGRTARVMANSVAMRYGLPPFVRLRPRPASDYGAAATESMRGNHGPTRRLFLEMLLRHLRGA